MYMKRKKGKKKWSDKSCNIEWSNMSPAQNTIYTIHSQTIKINGNSIRWISGDKNDWSEQQRQYDIKLN